MAEDIVDAQRLQAGRDYHQALVRLGFPVQAMLWTIPEERGIHSKRAAGIEGEMELGIVSTLIEREGPLKIYDLLWQAYDHAGTPKSISPWLVCLYGSRSRFGRNVRSVLNIEVGAATLHTVDAAGRRETVQMDIPFFSFANRLTRTDWIYKVDFGNRGNAADRRAIKTFERNVAMLKAA